MLLSKCVCCVYVKEEEMQPIPHSELTDLEVIGQGGFGVVYRAKHARHGTVVYKELDKKKLVDRYLQAFLIQPYCIGPNQAV